MRKNLIKYELNKAFQQEFYSEKEYDTMSEATEGMSPRDIGELMFNTNFSNASYNELKQCFDDYLLLSVNNIWTTIFKQLNMDRLHGYYDIIEVDGGYLYYANYNDSKGEKIKVPDGLLRARKIPVKKFLRNFQSSIQPSLADISRMNEYIERFRTIQ